MILKRLARKEFAEIGEAARLKARDTAKKAIRKQMKKRMRKIRRRVLGRLAVIAILAGGVFFARKKILSLIGM